MARVIQLLSVLTLDVAFALSTVATAQPNNTTPAPATRTTTATAVKPSKVTKPLWNELKAEQHKALAPLQGEWLKMSEAQKRKWLELSKNYAKLSSDDQSKLHARMSDWVKLSPEQRANARLNFSAAKTLSPEEKQKQWEAYQALSPDEKAKLQAKASTPNSAALAAKPQNKVFPGKTSTADSALPAATLAPAQK